MQRTAPAAAACILTLLAACTTTSSSVDDVTNKDHTVLYEVGGTVDKASVTYTDGNTQTTQDTDATVPWKKQIKSTGSTITFQVIAQNAGLKGGKISCKITVDGKVKAENESKGVGAIATCNT